MCSDEITVKGHPFLYFTCKNNLHPNAPSKNKGEPRPDGAFKTLLKKWQYGGIFK